MLKPFEDHGHLQGEESLFLPLLGPLKAEQPPLLITQATGRNDGRLYELQIYRDQVVGISGQAKMILCLDSEIRFRKVPREKLLMLGNEEIEKWEGFKLEGKREMDELSETLARVCAQRGFFDHYECLEELGKGKKSRVFKVLRKEDKQFFACKVQRNSSNFRKELKILEELRHPNLIYLREFFIEPDQTTYTIMDYQDGGDLLSLLQSGEELPTKTKIEIIGDLLHAMEYLRVKGIVHRDIKPENILYSQKEGRFKIGDFGFARRAGEKLDRIAGTPGYIAPEVIQNAASIITVESDIYSMGLVFFEIITGVQYFGGESPEEILHKNQKPKPLKKKVHDFDLRGFERDLLEKMVRTQPTNRKHSCEILSSSVFRKMQKVYASECRDSGSTRSPDSEDEEPDGLMKTVKKLLNLRNSS